MPSVASTIQSLTNGAQPNHPRAEARSSRTLLSGSEREPSPCRWIHPEKQRYYSVALVRDLFGDWTLLQCWGGIGSQLGGQRVAWVESYEAGLEQIAAIGKRRRQHGYREVVA